MTTLSDALARVPNPLAAHTVSDVAADSSWVDVATMHSQARQVLWQGGERARRGHSQVLVLVGEPGSGKSHLAQWLRQELALRGDPQTYFVAMPALPDLAQPFRHALRQLVGALCRKECMVSPPVASGAGEAAALLERPIDVLLWRALYNQTYDLLDAARVGMYQVPAALLKLLGPMCHDAGRKRRLEDFVAAAQKVWAQVEPGLRSYLLSLPTEMSIDSAARAVLLQFPYADRRALCTAWLAGEELAQKDRERLSAKQVINNENAAKYVLGSVVRLLTAMPGSQLIVVYDQAEQLVEQLGQPGVQAMSEVAATIQNCGGSSLQVMCVQPATLTELQGRPSRTAAGSGLLRYLDQTVRLEPTPPELLRELVAARLAVGLAETAERPSEVFPLTEADLDLNRWPKEASTPRAALQVFAQRYTQRLRELTPGSSPDQRRAKDAPSAPGMGRRLASTQSPSMDFMSNEVTGDALTEAVVPTRPELGMKPRSLTHPDESGAAATAPKTGAVKVAPSKGAPAKAAPMRTPAAFSLEDSSPTVQALPKEVVAAALLNSGAKGKLSPSFAADSSPTVRALSDDVMGRVRGAAAANKAAAPPASGKAQTVTPPTVSSGPTGENVVMGRVVGAKPAAKGPEAAPLAAKAAEKAPEKLPEKTAAKGDEKGGHAVPTAIKTTDAVLTRKTEHSAVPTVADYDVDSSPTLRRMPDESLIKATRDRSKPHSSIVINRASAVVPPESGVIGRATPPAPAQASLLQASRPSNAPAKPAAPEKAATKPPAAKPTAMATTPPKAPVVVPPPSNVPDPLPPSAESPSMGWLAMASSEQDPLADAIKQAKEDLAITVPTKAIVALAEPPPPAPSATPPKQPSAPAAAKTGSQPLRPAAAVSAPVAVKPLAAKTNPPAATAAPIPPTAALPADNVPTELPPSAESPSMGWLAMASGSNQLDDAIAQAKSDLPSAAKAAPSPAEPRTESGPTAARTARPMRDAGGLGVVVVNPSTVKPAEPPPEAEPAKSRAPARSTLARMPALQLRPTNTVSPQQVVSVLSGRGMMEDWQLAQELGLLPDALEKTLLAMEDEGQIRLMAMGDGQRMVVLID